MPNATLESFRHYCIGNCEENIIHRNGRIKYVQKWKLTFPNGNSQPYSSKEKAREDAAHMGWDLTEIDGD